MLPLFGCDEGSLDERDSESVRSKIRLRHNSTYTACNYEAGWKTNQHFLPQVSLHECTHVNDRIRALRHSDELNRIIEKSEVLEPQK